MSRLTTSVRRLSAVVIGGSAGAVDGLMTILPALGFSCGVAVFVIVHLPRERPSLLVDIFASKCALPVREAQDKEPVKTGTIYFGPPDYHLLIDKGPRLALSADEPVHYSRPAIDVLFESAADAYADQLLGVVLSGANEDGAAGLKAVQDAGGLTLVQRPDSAAARTMPLAALSAAPGSLAVSLTQIVDLLRQVVDGGIATTAIEDLRRA